MFLVFNTVRMYREMLRGTGAAVKPTSQCFTFFSGGEKKTWQKKGKCEVFSHSLIEQAVLAGIKWINVKSDSLTKPHERHKPTRGLENSSVGIMNRVQLEILLAVQLGALHARSYWALQYWAEGKLSTLSLMSKDLSGVRCNYVRWWEKLLTIKPQDEGSHTQPGRLFAFQLQCSVAGITQEEIL